MSPRPHTPLLNSRLLAGSLCLGMVLMLSACNKLPNPFNRNSAQETEATASQAPASQEDLKATFQAGVDYGKQGQWNLAIEQYKQILAKDPNYASAHANLGWAYAETEQFEEAVKSLHKALSLEPNNASARANLAWAYAELKQYTLAVQEAEKSTALDGKNPYAFATLGWAAMETGQFDKANAAYQKALALKPDLDTAHLALGNMACGQKQPDKAQEHLTHLRQMGSPLASDLSTTLAKGCK